ncbi:MAG: NAD-binding protein [Candidatus Eremiobacteraeota bacterium]|nr:NAD-binding protein [Candidatus Eremiobacteraeota bacterium]
MPLALSLVTGEDALAERVCAELIATGGVRVCLISSLGAERKAAFERVGATVLSRKPDGQDALHEAGVETATTILTLSNDDEANLAVALWARMLNPRIRVVLRQFGTKIGRKIEQNLPDCSVISPAAHAASTYAGAALDPGCFFALRFPEMDTGILVGFTTNTAGQLGIASLTVGAAEDAIDARIVAVGDRDAPPPGMSIGADDPVVVFGRIVERRAPVELANDARLVDLTQVFWMRLRSIFLHVDPILRTTLIAATAFYGVLVLFFHFAVRSPWNSAAFDVAELATNAGFGDASITRRGAAVTATIIAAMIGGTTLTSILIGYISAAINRAQWTALQGLRRIRGRGHVVICGAGRTGSAVVDLLLRARKHVVVVDPAPDPFLMRLARKNAIDLLTGDATHEDVLELCNIPHASAVVVLTNNDPGNLEIALGARALRPDVPLVVRMENRTFAQATSKLFGIATFSPAVLSAPAFAGLARFSGSLGRVPYGGVEHSIVRRHAGDAEMPPAAAPLCAWHDGALTIVRSGQIAEAADVVLYALAQSATGA